MRAAALLAAAGRPPQPLLIALSAGAWLALVVAPQSIDSAAVVCGTGASGSVALSLAILRAQPPLRPWLLMLIAMMLPLLARPLDHVWVRSLPRRRWQAVAEFLVAYVMVWTAAGAALVLLAILLRASVGSLTAAALPLAGAVAWRATPAWQVCQNRCHGIPRLDTFGLAAELDCLAYGARAAFWCIGTCWALMLLPLLVRAHLPVMMAVALVAFIDRQAPPRPLRRWRWRPAPSGRALPAPMGTVRSTRRAPTPKQSR